MRGLQASYSRSTIRLNAIAVERAPTIATITHSSCRGVGSPLAARIALNNAKGSEKGVLDLNHFERRANVV